MQLTFILSFLLLILPALSSYNHSSNRNGTWIPLANITIEPRQEHTTVALNPKTLYIIAGIATFLPNQTTDPTTNIVQSYSMPKNTWSPAASLPKVVNHPNAAVVDGKIYVLGGLSPSVEEPGLWDKIPDCWVYSPRDDVWTSIGTMPAGHARGSAAVGVHGKKIYLAGGLLSLDLRIPTGEGQITTDVVTSYDTVTGEWSVLPKLPEGRDHAGAAVIENTFYVLGGRKDGQVNVKDTVFALDLPDAKEWKLKNGKMPTPRGGVATAVIGNRVFTFGGEGNPEAGSNGVFPQTEVYDVRRDTWERLGSMAVPRHGTSAVGIEGNVYIPGGGVVQGGAPVNVFNKFVPPLC